MQKILQRREISCTSSLEVVPWTPGCRSGTVSRERSAAQIHADWMLLKCATGFGEELPCDELAVRWGPRTCYLVNDIVT